jgi:Na+(H+)/acetate symporter ActP
MVGTAGLPHVIVRFFTVKRVKDARKSAGYALVLIAFYTLLLQAIVCFAKTNLIETVNGKTILLCQLGLLNGKQVHLNLKIKWRWQNSILQRQLKDAAFFSRLKTKEIVS